MRCALPALLVLIALSCPGCPGEAEKNVPPASQPTSAGTAAAVSSSTPSSPKPWAAQAERVAALLDEVVEKAEAGDRQGALAAHENAYFTGYENEDWNIEVLSKQRLGEEPLDGRMRNVAQVREEAFRDLKGMVSHGAPAAKVRALANELAAKIRDDARQLDELKAPPR